MAGLIELVVIFATAFGFNLIPFAGPSNLLIATTAAIGLGNPDPTTMVVVGVLIAVAAALAKGIHYMVTFFVSGHLSKQRQEDFTRMHVKLSGGPFHSCSSRGVADSRRAHSYSAGFDEV